MPESPLMSGGLLHGPSFNPGGSFLENRIALTGQALRFLLECDSLDPELSSYCRWISRDASGEDLPFNEDFRSQIVRFAESRSLPRGAVCLLHGSDQFSRMSVAQAISGRRRTPLLLCNIGALLDLRTPASFLSALLCELRLRGASLFCDDWHLLASDVSQGKALARALQRIIADLELPVFLSSRTKTCVGDHVPAGCLVLRVPGPDAQARKAEWTRYLAADNALAFDVDRLAALALSRPQVEAAAKTARLAAEITGSQLCEPDLVSAAHDLARPHLISFAKRVRPRRQWADLILPKDTILQLREFCAQVKNWGRVQDDWGFGRRFAAGKGVIALFVGATGTGKTLASEVIANDLGLDLYKVDLASIVSKYIGETEKNLARVFEDAEDARALLFFDEADALFGKRSEVKDSHDRYANIEINYLLQRVEDFEGTIILASNLSKNIDPAFLRRLSFSIEFPFPDEEQRRLIWQSIFPARAPLSADLDVGLLARNFRISGGNIKNIAVAAAFQAADNGGVIDMHHVILALKREYQKLGRVCEKSEFERFYDLVRS